MKCFRHKLSDKRGLQAQTDGHRTKPLPRRPLAHLPRPGWGGGPPSVDHIVPATSCCSNTTAGRGCSGPAASLRSSGDVPAQLSVWTPCAACRAPRLRLACQSTPAQSTFSIQGQNETRAFPKLRAPGKLTGREAVCLSHPLPGKALAEWAWPPWGGGPQLRAPGSLREGRHWQNGPGHRGAGRWPPA